ncbi:MAG: TonB-dependent receptor [Saprospiraceae bacterium]|nr:TonB-dependent receptor [Saprospiraceae bacterium]
MKKLFILNLCLAISGLLNGQAIDSIHKMVPLQETVVSASRTSQAKSAVAQQVKVIHQREIESVNAQSTADLLINSGQVFVQKSQQGGGSPVLRGFEASRVLLVVDGVRMNNAIYRAGHLQNAITMDNAALERVELLFGPASTVYGTDALGGAICFFTKKPELATDGGLNAGAHAFVRYGTVNNEKTGHLDFNLGGKKIGSFTSFTYSDFGDLRMGEKTGLAPFFGRRDYYVDRINGVDSLVKNSDPYLQKFSGFTQYDVLEKILFQPNSRVKHTLNLQFSNSSNIPRYDRLTDTNGNGLNSAEWYYGPQKRLMGAYTLNLMEVGMFDGLNFTASYQDIDESRYNRNFAAPRRTAREENVKVYGFLAELFKNWETHSLRIGIDGQYNDVTSKAYRVNVNTGETSTQSTRYPDGGSNMINVAGYATHQWQVASNSPWILSEGIRVGYSTLNASFISREFYPFPFDEVKQGTPVFSGNLGAVWNSPANWRLAFNLSSGFRVPNVDDLTKVFDSQKGSVIVPNTDVKPEKTINLDVNLSRRIAGKLNWENVLWATAFRDAIVLDLYRFNGLDSIDYDGVLSRVLAPQNKRAANMFGFSSNLEVDLSNSLAFYGSVAYTYGRIQDENKPLDHIPPLYGKAGVRYYTSKWSAEFFSLFNGKKRLEDYNLEGEDNLQYAPADGMPAWVTFNLRGSFNFNKNIGLQAGIDNILDMQYRHFASGINAPGRNIWLTLRVRV